MKYLLIKDNKRRQLWKKTYYNKILYKYYFKQLELNQFIYMLKLNKFSRNSSISRLKNRCVYSARGVVLNKYKMSRFFLKKYLNMGLLNGFTKASW